MRGSDELARRNAEVVIAYGALDDAVKGAVKTSENNIGIFVDGMTLRAYNMLSRAAVLGLSLLSICKIADEGSFDFELLVDHVAIASIARTMMETCLLLSYCAETGVSQEEVELRYLIFRMHDTHARYLLFKEMSVFAEDDVKEASVKERDDFRRGVDLLRNELGQNKLFSTIPDEKKKGVLAGKDMYIRGCEMWRGVSKS